MEENIQAENIAEVAEPQESPAGAENTEQTTKSVSERINQVREQARAEAFAEAKRVNDAFAKDFGHNSWDDMLSYEEERKKQEMNEQVQSAGLDPSVINGIVQQQIESHPAIKEAREITMREHKERGERAVADDLAKISQLDPTIKTVEDLQNLPNFQEIVQRLVNMSLYDAYRLVNFDAIKSNTTAAAKQSALNQMGGKNHLAATHGGANVNEIPVPDDTMEIYRRLLPKSKDEDFRKHYAASQ